MNKQCRHCFSYLTQAYDSRTFCWQCRKWDDDPTPREAEMAAALEKAKRDQKVEASPENVIEALAYIANHTRKYRSLVWFVSLLAAMAIGLVLRIIVEAL